MPEQANAAIIQPSAEFKKASIKALGAIVLFIVAYLIMLVIAVAIAAGLALLGYRILLAGIGLISVIAGLALMTAGLWLVFFLIKFIFRSKKTNTGRMFAITKEEQPALVDFIGAIATEVGSSKPKKIFWGLDMDAFVFYNSTLWSMFFPVGKNICIGLGLINVINLSEFKAIIAHELGHFSQRSMRIGTYVNHMNRIIYNMLNENDGYNKWLNKWSRLHSLFKLMAFLNIGIISGIQKILKSIYIVVNKSNLNLSRQMEYHADAIAAYSAGSNQLMSALARVNVGQTCFQNAAGYVEAKFKTGKCIEDFYELQRQILKLYADKQNFKTDDLGLPIVDGRTIRKINDTIEVDNPWSTHPLTGQREARLTQINLITTCSNYSAWAIFNNAKDIQRDLTRQFYPGDEDANNMVIIPTEDIYADITRGFNYHRYNEIFKDYFDNREISSFDLEDAVAEAVSKNQIPFDKLISDANCRMPSEVVKLDENIALLEQIIEIRKDIKYFYYRTERWTREEAESLKSTLEQESIEIKKQIHHLDKQVYIFFFKQCKDELCRRELSDKYQLLFKLQRESTEDYSNYASLKVAMQPVYTKMQPPQIRSTVNEVYRKEKLVKPRIKAIAEDKNWQSFIDDSARDALKTYLKTNWIYYLEPGYDNTAISVFAKAMNAYHSVVSQRIFMAKTDLLNFEAGLLKFREESTLGL